jgi:trans-aconitate methyltransferase
MPLDPTIAAFDKHAQTYQQKHMDQARYAGGLNRCCELVGDDHGRLLDLGCGPGNVSRFILDLKPHLQAEAIDLSPSMVALASINLPEAKCRVEDVRELKAKNGPFHMILVGFCIPYLNRNEVGELIAAGYQQLTSDGILYLSFMEGDYDRSGFQLSSDGQDKAYIHYYPAEEITAALEASGFVIDTLLRTDFEKADGKKDVDVQIVAVKMPATNHDKNGGLC